MLPGDRPGFALHERDGEPLCLIGGRGYYNQTWPADECIAEGVTREAAVAALSARASARRASAVFRGRAAHRAASGRLEGPGGACEASVRGMDYWALGHVHVRYAYPSFDDPKLVFSGCIQGRDIKETGERGVYCVTLEKGRPNRIEPVPTASVVWQRLDVDVEDCPNLPAVTDKIMRELFRENGKAHCEEMVSRITLRGATPLHAVLERPDVLADLRKHLNDSYPLFFCVCVGGRDHRCARQGGPAQGRAVPGCVFAGGRRAAKRPRPGGGVSAGRVSGKEHPAARVMRPVGGPAGRGGGGSGSLICSPRGRTMTRPYLEHIKITAFGALSNKAVGPFASGLNVVIGRNEAGKTTVASFVGGVLFGWEEAPGRAQHLQAGERRAVGLAVLLAAGRRGRSCRVRATPTACRGRLFGGRLDRETFKTMFSLTSGRAAHPAQHHRRDGEAAHGRVGHRRLARPCARLGAGAPGRVHPRARRASGTP